jgi:glutamate synthase domain-containing protein 1/glutamate synthase domain-containing protein 3
MVAPEDLYDTTYGQPINKDGCGVFGVIRKSGAQRISNTVAVEGISCISYRGSSLGAGYASFDSTIDQKLKVEAFVRDEKIARWVSEKISDTMGETLSSNMVDFGGSSPGSEVLKLEFAYTSKNRSTIDNSVDEINGELLSNRRIDGRIFSYGKFLSVYKGVGYPRDIARMFHIDQPNTKFADMWIAHTRQPTNSPGSSPIWSHPFASLDCAIVHNGDISSFGANLELLNSLGYKSHVGTDSEVVARLLNHLIRVEGLSVDEAATILTNPFEDRVRGNSLLEALSRFRGAKLDGPFAILAGFEDDEDTYLIALTDRSKFRPLLFGEDEERYYVASEENQIRGISSNARVWTPEPGSFFIASVKRGLIASGTTRDLGLDRKSRGSVNFPQQPIPSRSSINASDLGFQEINAKISEVYEAGGEKISFSHLSGQRYIGIGFSPSKASREFKVELSGYPGNCLANLNDGGQFEIFGNAADDLGDTMHSGKIVVHGSARDVVGQALQGGEILVKGSVGNRAAIQMREYKNHRPFLIVGETADDYLGEYMAGGVVVILNISGQAKSVGSYVGTGMVGGRIYIRGKIGEEQIGLQPKKADILNYLRAAALDHSIPSETFDAISVLEFPTEKKLAELLPPDIFKRLRNLFFRGKYTKPISVEYRKLDRTDASLELEHKIANFFQYFGVPESVQESIMNSEYTVIQTVEDEERDTPIPPQEVPIEE